MLTSIALLLGGTWASVVDPGIQATWMRDLHSDVSDSTLWELTLPGTRHSLSYDLCPTLGNGVLGWYDRARMMTWSAQHFSLPSQRLQSVFALQSLTLTQQLDAGSRFLDIRVAPDSSGEWRGINVMNTCKLAVDYLVELNMWLEAHPSEVVVVFISRNGDPSSDGQFAGIPPLSVAQFWRQLKSALPQMANASLLPLATSSLSEFSSSGTRAVVLVADWRELTGSDSSAYDAKKSLNVLRGWGNAGESGEDVVVRVLKALPRTNLASQTTPPFALTILNLSPEFPISTAFGSFCMQAPTCPATGRDLAALANYFGQFVVEGAFKGADLPQVVLMDGLMVNGDVPIDRKARSDWSYPAVGRILERNKLRLDSASPQLTLPVSLRSWEDPDYGRRIL